MTTITTQPGTWTTYQMLCGEHILTIHARYDTTHRWIEIREGQAIMSAIAEAAEQWIAHLSELAEGCPGGAHCGHDHDLSTPTLEAMDRMQDMQTVAAAHFTGDEKTVPRRLYCRYEKRAEIPDEDYIEDMLAELSDYTQPRRAH